MVEQQWKEKLTKICKKSIDILSEMKLPLNPAIVFDIDNTLIDRKGECIEQIALLYNYAKMIGITLVLITSRLGTEKIINFTQNQLTYAKIKEYKFIYFKKYSDGDNWNFKRNARVDLHNKGFTTVMSVGDSDWDIYGDYTGISVKIPLNTYISNYYSF